MYRCLDIKTGRHAKPFAGFGMSWKSHRGLEAWWLLSLSMSTSDTYKDGHTFEVCVHNIGRNHSIPVWPILAFHDAVEAERWFNAVRSFIKTIPAANSHEFYDPDVNGDRRLSDWLTANGFVKYNHVWWVLGKPETAP